MTEDKLIVGYDHYAVDKDRLETLISGHAKWYTNVQRHLGDHSERSLENIEFVYGDAGVHFYKHGWEDAIEFMRAELEKDE